jgi:hypothetical protein
MKNVTIVGILIVSGFLTACHTKDSNTQTTTQVSAQAPVPVSPSPIDTVRNGYLESNKTTTVGKALEGTFPNGTWKTFITQKGVTIVEFDGFEPFGNFSVFGCEADLNCAALYKKLEGYCDSDAGKTAYLKEQTSYETLKTQVAQLRQQASALFDQASKTKDRDESLSINKKAIDMQDEENQLTAKLQTLPNGYAICLDTTPKQHANDPIPVVVQFSINQDGTTFQYEANDMGLSVEALFEKIYK